MFEREYRIPVPDNLFGGVSAEKKCDNPTLVRIGYPANVSGVCWGINAVKVGGTPTIINRHLRGLYPLALVGGTPNHANYLVICISIRIILQTKFPSVFIEDF
jgi:hypothetical protein